MKFYIFKILVFLAKPIGAIVDKLVRLERPAFLVQWFIDFYFVKKLGVNLEDAEKSVEEYKSTLSFFTRKLKKGARPLNPQKNFILSPVDGKIVSYGKIKNQKILQIKGKIYFLDDFLVKKSEVLPEKIIKNFENGFFVSLYLSPKDYHLLHHPYEGIIKKVIFCPGSLYPVNDFSLNTYPEVFVKNKRLLLHYQSQYGRRPFPFIAAWIGAFNVGSIKLKFDNEFYTSMKKTSSKVFFKDYNLKVTRGELGGAFELGSSVVLLFPQVKNINFEKIFKKETIKMGEPLLKINSLRS